MKKKKQEKNDGDTSLKATPTTSSTITIPRFDYNAPSALLRQSHSGFLVTCTIHREKSATLEALTILSKYIMSLKNAGTETSQTLESCDADTIPIPKRRKVLDPQISGECDDDQVKSNTLLDVPNTGKDDDSVSVPEATAEDASLETAVSLSLVKLARSGLLLLTFPAENPPPDTLAIVSDIFRSLESASLKSPLSWCHRIFPIQATCRLEEKELRAVVSKLVLQFVNEKQEKAERPIKFAVGYNRRGLEETQNSIKDTSTETEVTSLLDRGKCFEVVASAVKDAVSDSLVDLKSPEVCILVELLPLSGVANGPLVAGVSVLPRNLVSIKPRLCIKPLVSNGNAGAGRT